MASLRFVLFSVLTFMAMSSAQAQDIENHVVSIELQQTPIRNALAILLKDQASFVVPSQVSGDVTIAVKNVRLQTALQYLLKQVDARYTFDGNVFIIRPRELSVQELEFKPKELDPTIAVVLTKLDVRSAIRAIFQSCLPDRDYVIDDR